MRPYVPERYTPLSWSPVYAELRREERIRYNQLYGLMFNEFFLAFEGDFIERLVAAIHRSSHLDGAPQLRAALTRSLHDERRHRAMFRSFDRAREPELYRDRDRAFLRFGAGGEGAVRIAASRERLIAFNLKLAASFEGLSCRMARELLAEADGGELGPLDPGYRALHLVHLRDEERHVAVDDAVIALLDRRRSRWIAVAERKLVARLLVGLAIPRRASVRIIDRLIAEHPRLSLLRGAMIAGARSAADQPGWTAASFHPAAEVAA